MKNQEARRASEGLSRDFSEHSLAGASGFLIFSQPLTGTTRQFGAHLTLNAGSPTNLALTSAVIRGSVVLSNWNITGKLGSVRVTGDLRGFTMACGGLGGIAALNVTGTIETGTIHSVGRLATITAGNWSGTNVTGNVAAFTVGRFQNSKLYVAYTPDTDFITEGTFTGNFTLVSFRTTQVYRTNLTQTLAFTAGSEVVAHKFGSVVLSGMLTDNFSTPFGLRCNGQANRGSVRVIRANPNAIPTTPLLPTDLTPFMAGDFHFFTS